MRARVGNSVARVRACIGARVGVGVGVRARVGNSVARVRACSSRAPVPLA